MLKESRRGPFVPKDRTVVVLTKNGDEKLYFIDKVSCGSVTRETMLLGQYLSDFIESPGMALPLRAGCTDRVYFPCGSGIAFFAKPTKDDLNNFTWQLKSLAEINPYYKEMIEKILKDVDKQRNLVEELLPIIPLDLPKENSVIKVKLSKKGIGAFRYLKDTQEGQEELYFISAIKPGPVEDSVTLAGQFLLEFEGCPKDALPMEDGNTNTLYLPNDNNIISYKQANETDAIEFIERMMTLAKQQKQFGPRIGEILIALTS